MCEMERETERQRERQRERQTQRETDTQRDRERERENEAVMISGLSLVIERFQPGLMPSPIYPGVKWQPGDNWGGRPSITLI